MDTRALFQSSAEHPNPLTIPVEGTLPDWFRGTYCSVGNGLFDLPSGFTVNHSYDGYSILYSIRVTDNKQAVVMSKFLNSEAYEKAMLKGQPVFEEFGTKGSSDPDKGLFSRILSQLVPIAFTDNGFMNLIKLRGRIFTTSETCFIHQLNPETLKSMQKVDLLKIFGFAYFTGHPVYDQDGSSYCIGCSIGTTLKMNIVQFLPPPPSKGKKLTLEEIELSPKDMKIVASMPSSWKTSFGYIHSFGMTEKYFVVYEQPFRVNNLKILTSHLQGRVMKDNFEWHPDEQMRFILIDRSNGTELNTKYMAAPLFISHVVNAYEEKGHVILDLIGRKSTAVIDHLSVEILRDNKFLQHNDPPHVYRFVFPIVGHFDELASGNLVTLKDSKAKAEKINSHIFCTPTIIGLSVVDYPSKNPNYEGKKYRYFYGTSYFEEPIPRIFKVDLLTGETHLLKYGECQSLSEPLFVLNPDAQKEDDGLLIVSMSDTRHDHPSAILYVDAATLKEVGRVTIPYKTAHIQHGIFIPS